MNRVALRLAREHIRCDVQASCTKIAGMALAIAVLAASAGTERGIGRSADLGRVLVGNWFAGLLLFAACVALIYVAISKYMDVTDRSQELGLLHVFGAGYGYVASMLAWETLLLGLPAAAIGILTAFVLKLVVTLFFSRVLAVDLGSLSCIAAVAISGTASFVGGSAAVRGATRIGVMEAISYRK